MLELAYQEGTLPSVRKPTDLNQLQLLEGPNVAQELLFKTNRIRKLWSRIGVTVVKMELGTLGSSHLCLSGSQCCLLRFQFPVRVHPGGSRC